MTASGGLVGGLPLVRSGCSVSSAQRAVESAQIGWHFAETASQCPSLPAKGLAANGKG